jgi:ADP-ribose pyrophosphatase
MADLPEHKAQWQGKFLRVMQCGRWEYADRVGTSGAVAILAITPDGSIVLTEQFRIPLQKRVIELPAGLAGDSPAQFGEPLAEAAHRELLEETGYSAGEMVLLTSGPPSAGLATEIVSFFLARRLQRTGAGGGDHHEEIQVHEVPLTGVEAWLKGKTAEGLLVDPKVYAGLYFACTQ